MEPLPKIELSEVTPPEVYFNRRNFIRAGSAVASVAATAGLYRWLNPTTLATAQAKQLLPDSDPNPTTETGGSTGGEINNQAAPNAPQEVVQADVPPAQTQTVDPRQEQLDKGFVVDEPNTPLPYIINYNNFYEFSTSKEAVAFAASGFRTEGWQIKVDGLVDKPQSFSIDQLHALSAPQERIYRMRCVEGWSMVIPWAGVPLFHLLEAVQPQSSARYVAFETLLDIERMPGQRSPVLEWPYVEGLRLDEAMHPLTLLATGLYRRLLPPQDGAPVRLVVPWKYGFKGIKSIVRISLVAEEPPTSWNKSSPQEYGFYANVNPEVDHPRWSQATEQRIGERGRRKTLMFNGYAPQVAKLYDGMDLRKYF